ncbi:MAG: D-alanyl-D-alanine carboxypeptidase [Alphaproteobacteria bacterium]|nr:D-alanyl-D-alanine carboxypeptidase [Alphaproteobacteria bacterium]
MVAKSLIRSRIAFACLTTLMLLSGVAAPTGAYAAKAKAVRVIRPILPSPEKDAALVVDGATGKVIYARNPDAIRYPASLTKMMTLYMLFEALEKGTIALDTPLIVSSHAAEQQPTKLSAPLGSTIPVETAIKALTVLSANDIAVVIAEALADGSESAFASMMTERAHQLGMTHTNFHNASGLPDLEQLTTARDMALLGRHIAYDFPQYYHYFSTPSFTYGGRVFGSHDNLLTAFDGTDGIKTGYTQLSGFNLVTSAVRNNKHVVGVVLGGPSAAVRDREMMRLLNAAFKVSNDNPTILADANVPWKGGNGPATELYRPDPGEDDVLLAALETKGRQAKGTAPVLTAEAAAAPTLAAVPLAKPDSAPRIQMATLVPLLKAAPVARQLELASTKEPPLNLGAPALKPTIAPPPVAEGDAVGAPLVAFNPKPPGDGLVKRWAVQIGVFASETLAEAQLAAFAKRGVDIVGQAQRVVIPFASLSGHTLYRARLGLFAEEEARDICKRMAQRGQACVVAPPA